MTTNSGNYSPSIPSEFPMWVQPSDRIWDDVLHRGFKKIYKYHEIILDRYTKKRALYYVYSGRVRCEHVGNRGNFKVCFYVESGSMFGEAPLFSGIPVVPSLVFSAMTESVIYTFSYEDLKNDILKNNFNLTLSILQSMAYKIRMYSTHISSITLADVPGQVCKFLYQMLLESGDAQQCRPLMTQQEMADMLGVHRNTVMRAIKKIKKEGLIDVYTSKCLRVRDRNALLERGKMHMSCES